MITLPFGVLLPQTGDRGVDFFPALEDNMTYLDSHDHSGIGAGAPIPATNISPITQVLLAASWVAYVDGTYRQSVTVPGGKTFSSVHVAFRGTTDFETYQLGTDANTLTSFYVYTNDPTLTVTATYRS